MSTAVRPCGAFGSGFSRWCGQPLRTRSSSAENGATQLGGVGRVARDVSVEDTTSVRILDDREDVATQLPLAEDEAARALGPLGGGILESLLGCAAVVGVDARASGKSDSGGSPSFNRRT